MCFSVNIFLISIALLLSFLFCLAESQNFKHLPEQDMNTPEIIQYYGYPAEIHETTTADGYILQMHRIPFGIIDNETVNPSPSSPFDHRYESKQRPVFFLQHGLLATSADWVLNLPSQSLGFLLADAGFDVWMGNVRGNWYSNKHLNYSTSHSLYWQFTWDEMAEHDLPAMVNTVLEITKQKSLYYIGHSQGTEIMFARLASDPRFAKKINKFFALAPVSTIGHIRGLLSWIGKYLGNYIWVDLVWLCPRMGTDFIPWYPPSHTPAGTSTWNILHWAQMYRSKTVQKFDFGSRADNLKHYGQDKPPLYNLSLVNAPTYLYYSESDWLGDAADVRASLLAAVSKHFIKMDRNLPSFNHFDFLWGMNAPKEIYSEIIRTSQQHNRNIMEQAKGH